MPEEQISVRIEVDLLKQIDKEAEKQHRSRNGQILFLLNNGIKATK